MKRNILVRVLLAVVLVFTLSGLTGCVDVSDTSKNVQKETDEVAKQDGVYLKTQPVPFYNYSIPRDLWTQFYNATTAGQVRTWSCEVSDYGTPVSEIYESIGYPIPMDTQLTNPYKISSAYLGDGRGWSESHVLAQSEPNGLYTSPNTNATIIMVADDNGKVVPLYSEHKVQSWPFPVEWDDARKIFVRKGKASIQLDPKGK